ncbi:hypothetical protein [Parapedobacter sp. DT-150]|uniref:hypothetical protein n=1 Tax=Parapedobacter sp. DT-150 TaxID=3396162 RepID=UPI003F1CDB1A
MKSKTITLAFALLNLLSAHAQRSFDFSENPAYKPSLGGLVGTTGVGLAFYHPLGVQFGLQAGVSLMPYNTQIVAQYGEHETRSEARARLHNAHLLLGWVPFYRAENGFRHLAINVGVGYLFQAQGTIDTRLNESYYYGDIELPPADIGTMHTTISWDEAVVPYGGLSFGDVRIDDHFGLNFALGGYLLSQPRVEVVGTGLLQGNEANQPIIERNIKNYRYLPNLQLGIAYSFNAY